MKYIYTTYFNITYLPKALVLIESLQRVDPKAKIVCLCIDKICEGVLRRLKIKGVILLPISKLEKKYPDLSKAKSNRPPVEYFWTQTPFLCRYILEVYQLDAIYVDADLKYFYTGKHVTAEIGSKSVAICPHWYPAYHDKSNNSGRFNVGWNYFKNDRASRKVLMNWSKDCLNSTAVNSQTCGDQKYLSKWPSVFDSVHIMTNQGLDCAPWNFYAFQISQADNKYYVNGEQLILFHFHGLNQYKKGFFWPNISYPITYHQLVLYLGYIMDLRRNTKLITNIYPQFENHLPQFRLLHEFTPFMISLLVIMKRFLSPAKYAIT